MSKNDLFATKIDLHDSNCETRLQRSKDNDYCSVSVARIKLCHNISIYLQSAKTRKIITHRRHSLKQ